MSYQRPPQDPYHQYPPSGYGSPTYPPPPGYPSAPPPPFEGYPQPPQPPPGYPYAPPPGQGYQGYFSVGGYPPPQQLYHVHHCEHHEYNDQGGGSSFYKAVLLRFVAAVCWKNAAASSKLQWKFQYTFGTLYNFFLDVVDKYGRLHILLGGTSSLHFCRGAFQCNVHS